MGKGFFFSVWQMMTFLNFLKFSKKKMEDCGKSSVIRSRSVSRTSPVPNSQCHCGHGSWEGEVLMPALSSPGSFEIKPVKLP